MVDISNPEGGLPLNEGTLAFICSDLGMNGMLLPATFQEVIEGIAVNSETESGNGDVNVEELNDINLNASTYDETSKLDAEECLVVERLGEISASISVPQTELLPSINHVSCQSSSLPASQDWPGEYGFNVTFAAQEKNTKSVAWIYSGTKSKLYVGKDAPCPVNFSTNTIMPDDVSIRAMALYTAPDQVFEVVQRCMNHSMKELKKGVFEAEHLIRCESTMAIYHLDEVTGRHSVTVPFENPPVGQPFSTYIFKFACFGSCSGGPNRRPLMVVFTLERKEKVIGRKKLDIKICACPGRDCKVEEQQCYESEVRTSIKRKEPSECGSLLDCYQFTKSAPVPSPEKKKVAPNKDGGYEIVVKDLACYNYLKHMKQVYEMYSMMSNISPNVNKILFHNMNMKSENDDE